MLNAIDRGAVSVVRATDRWLLVSTVINLAIIFFKIVDPFVSRLLSYAGITGYRYTQTFMYLKAKPFFECFFLLFPWIGNNYVKTHREYYDLKTINNNPECIDSILSSYNLGNARFNFMVKFLTSDNFKKTLLTPEKLQITFPELDFSTYSDQEKSDFIQKMIGVNPNVLRHPHIFEQISPEIGKGISIFNTCLTEDKQHKFLAKLLTRAPSLLYNVDKCEKNLYFLKNVFSHMNSFDLMVKILVSENFEKPQLEKDKLQKIFPELNFTAYPSDEKKSEFIQKMIGVNPNVLRHPHIFEQISPEIGKKLSIFNTCLTADTEFMIKLLTDSSKLMYGVNKCHEDTSFFQNLFAKMDLPLFKDCLKIGLKEKPELFLHIDEEHKKEGSFLIFCEDCAGGAIFKYFNEENIKKYFITLSEDEKIDEKKLGSRLDYLSHYLYENLPFLFKAIDDLMVDENATKKLKNFITHWKNGEYVNKSTFGSGDSKSENTPEIFKYFNEEKTKDIKFIKYCFEINRKIVSFVSPSDIDDTDDHSGYLNLIVELAHENTTSDFLAYLPLEVYKNKDMINYLLKNINWDEIHYPSIKPGFWKRIRENLNIDPEYMLSLISLYPNFFKYALDWPENKIWLEDFLKFVTQGNLKDNLQIIEKLMTLTTDLFDCLPINVRNDKESIKILIECVGSYCSKKSEIEIGSTKHDPHYLHLRLWQSLNGPLNMNIDIVVEFFKIAPDFFRSEYMKLSIRTIEFLETKEFLEKCLEYIIIEKKVQDWKKYLEGLLYNYTALEHLPLTVKKNKDLIFLLAKQLFELRCSGSYKFKGENIFPPFWAVIDPTLKDNLDFVIEFVEIGYDSHYKEYRFFDYLPELRKNEELIKRLVIHHPNFVRHITIEDLKDPSRNAFTSIQLYTDFIKELYGINDKILLYVDKRAFQEDYFIKKFANKDNFFLALCQVEKQPFLSNRITTKNKCKHSLNDKVRTLILCIYAGPNKKSHKLTVYKILSFLWVSPNSLPKPPEKKQVVKLLKSEKNKLWNKEIKPLDREIYRIDSEIKNNVKKITFSPSYCNQCSNKNPLKSKLIKRMTENLSSIKLKKQSSKLTFPKICCGKCDSPLDI